jgi:hypothetical protein
MLTSRDLSATLRGAEHVKMCKVPIFPRHITEYISRFYANVLLKTEDSVFQNRKFA